ncbi:MAG TPA: hypothetical protein VNT77_05620 [Allosphingosinicella sp.]|nr:hypothetical protein [Allosphingosinicella sp.]
MRKFILPLLAASTLTLGGCAYGLGGDPLTGILGSVLGGGGYGQGGYGAYGNQEFQRAAVNACGNYASRYGRVSIANVEMRSGDTLRVYGTVSDGYRGRNFACSFRADGRITDFDI